MALVDIAKPPPFLHDHRLYVRAPQPLAFPAEERPEEHVSETKRHLEIRTTLYLLLKDALAGIAIGSDQFVYWDAGDPQKCLSPDLFVKLGAREEMFEVWKIWERGAPDLGVEIVSASDRRDADWSTKLARYQSSGIGEVVRFDPDGEQPLRVWDRIEGELLERASESAHLCECVALGLWWVTAPSPSGPMLRLARDREGLQLLPTVDEDRVRLEAEVARERTVRSAAEHARALAEEQAALAEEQVREERAAREAAEAELARLWAELKKGR